MCKRLFRSVSCFVATIDVPGFRTHLDSQCENIARLHLVNIVFSFSVPLLSLLLFLLLVLCLFLVVFGIFGRSEIGFELKC